MLKRAVRNYPFQAMAWIPAAAIAVLLIAHPAAAGELPTEADTSAEAVVAADEAVSASEETAADENEGEGSAAELESLTVAVDDMEFVLVRIPGGTFTMGDEDGQRDEVPLHDVTVDDFYLGKFEVTQELYEKVMRTNPSKFTGCPTCPVEGVAHNATVRNPDATKFLAALGRMTNMTFRLPTEAEWEYAARGGLGHRWAGTNSEEELPEYGWFKDNSEGKTHPVGEKKPNAFGLYDMSGNVWEWCSDWYKEDYYAESPAENPPGARRGHARSLKGGSWKNSYKSLRSADRHRVDPGFVGLNLVGFRIAMDAPQPPEEEAATEEGAGGEGEAPTQ